MTDLVCVLTPAAMVSGEEVNNKWWLTEVRHLTSSGEMACPSLILRDPSVASLPRFAI